MLVTYIENLSYYHDKEIWNFDNNVKVNKFRQPSALLG